MATQNTTTETRPTIKISNHELRALLHLPEDAIITDLWTSDYDTTITVEYED